MCVFRFVTAFLLLLFVTSRPNRIGVVTLVVNVTRRKAEWLMLNDICFRWCDLSPTVRSGDICLNCICLRWSDTLGCWLAAYLASQSQQRPPTLRCSLVRTGGCGRCEHSSCFCHLLLCAWVLYVNSCICKNAPLVCRINARMVIISVRAYHLAVVAIVARE